MGISSGVNISGSAESSQVHKIATTYSMRRVIKKTVKNANSKRYMHRMFTAALFIIAKLWKQPKCPSIDEWIKVWNTYTMDYYPAIKMNEILPFATTWMDLTEIGQSEKDKYHVISLICVIKEAKQMSKQRKKRDKQHQDPQIQKTYWSLPKGR